MREVELCRAILTRAYETRQTFPLLHLLEAYDQVLAARHLSPDTPQATNVYRVLLRWGRDQSLDWWAKFRKEFESDASLTVQDLEGSSKGAGSSPSFDEKVHSRQNSKLFFQAQASLKDQAAFSFGVEEMKTQKFQLDSPPTKEIPLAAFVFSLPKFRDFLRRNKALSDAQLIAAAFHEQRLKSLALYCFRISKETHTHKHFQTKVADALATKARTSLVTKAWLQAATHSKQRRVAETHYLQQLGKKYFEVWTQLSLLKFKGRLSKAIARKFVCQRYFRYWKRGKVLRKLTQGQLFTAEFVYKQWLLKKCLIGFNRRLQVSLKFKVYEKIIHQTHTKALKSQTVQGWKAVTQSKALSKALYLKGYTSSYRLGLKLGWRKLQTGLEELGKEEALMAVAGGFWRERTRPKLCELALKRLYQEVGRKRTRSKARNTANLALKRTLFAFLRDLADSGGSKAALVRKALSSRRQKAVLGVWYRFQLSSKAQVRSLSPSFLFAAYRWLHYHSQSSVQCSPPSTRSRSSASLLQFPTVFLRDIGKVRCQTTLQAEAQLRLWYSQQIMRTWKKCTKLFRLKHKQYRENHIKPLFSAWKAAIHQLTWHRFQLSKTVNRKKTAKMGEIVRTWWRYSLHTHTVKRIFARKMAANRQEIVTGNWTKWRSLYLTRVKHRSESKLSQNLFKGKYMGRCLQEWRSRLRQLLKKRHLRHTGDKFAFQRVLTTGWRTWRSRYLASLELNLTSEQVISSKEAAFVAKLFATWQRIVPVLKRNTRLRELAALKYNRKLAKRGLTALYSYTAYAQHKAAVYGTALHRAAVVLQKNCFLGLKFYAEFRKEQKLRDSQQIPIVRKVLKGLRFRQWYTRALLYSSCRYMPELLAVLQKRQFLRRLEQNKDSLQLADAYMQVRKEKSTQSAVLSAWHHYVHKRALLDEAERRFRLRDRHFRRLIPFTRWRKAFTYEQNCMRLFYKGVLCLKREYLQGCMRCWKLFRGYRLRKRYSATHRELTLAKQTVTAWRKLAGKKQLLGKLRTRAGLQLVQEQVKRVFYTWLSSAIKKQQCHYNSIEITNARKRRVLEAWRRELRWRLRQGEVAEAVEALRLSQRKRRGIRYLRTYAIGKVAHLQTIRKAKKARKATLENRYFAAFLTFHVRKAAEKAAFERIFAKQMIRIGQICYRQWRKAAEPAIQRLKGLRSLISLHSLLSSNSALQQWKQGVRLDIETDKKVTEIRNAVLKGSVIGAFKQHSVRAELKREQMQSAEELQFRLRSKRVLRRLQGLMMLKTLSREWEDKGKTQYEQHLGKWGIGVWTRAVAAQKAKKEKQGLARDFRLQRIAPITLQVWKTRVAETTVQRSSRQLALNHYKAKLLQKAIRAFNRLKLLASNKKEVASTAQGAYSAHLKAKAFHQLRQYGSARVSGKDRKQHFSFKVSTTRSRNLTSKAMEALRWNKKVNAERVILGRVHSGELLGKRCFASWHQTVLKRRQETGLFNAIRSKIAKRTKRLDFLHWRKQRAKLFSLKKFHLKLKRRSMYRNLSDWRRALKLKFMYIRKDYAYKRAAFEILSKYTTMSLQAQAILKGVGERLEKNFVKRIISKWSRNLRMWKKTEAIRHSSKIGTLRTAVLLWKKDVAHKRTARLFTEKIADSLQSRAFEQWRIAQVRHSKQVGKLASVASAISLTWKRNSVKGWKKAARASKVWETVTQFIIEPRTVRYMSESFLAWKLHSQVRNTLKQVSDRYIQGKLHQRKLALFQAFASLHSDKLQKEALISGKDYSQSVRAKKRIVKGWKSLVKKRSALSDMQIVMRRTCQRHNQRLFLALWRKQWRQMEDLRGFERTLDTNLVGKWMEVWVKLTTRKRNQSAFGKLLAKYDQKYAVFLVKKWRIAAKELASMEQKADLMVAQTQRKAKSAVLLTLRTAAHRHHRHSSLESHLNITRARRVFHLFSAGCQLSHLHALSTASAVEHYSKRLMLSSLVGWRVWMQHQFESHVEADHGYLQASEHHSRQILAKSFLGWAETAREAAYIQSRSRSYAIFSAWKVHTREMALLKKYLQECNLSDRFMQSSRDVQESSRSSVFATLRSLGSSGTTTRELTELSAERGQP